MTATFTERAKEALVHLDESPVDRDTTQLVTLALETVRAQVDAEVAYLAEIVGRYVHIATTVGEPARVGLAAGMRMPVGDSLCGRVLAGRVGGVIRDVAGEPAVTDLARADGAGSFAGAPVTAPDGYVVGMLCAANRDPRPDDLLWDIGVLEVVAALVAVRLDRACARRHTRQRLRRRLRAIIEVDAGPDGQHVAASR